MIAAEFFGETLRAFELAGGPGRPERLEARRIQIVDHTGGDRRIRADDDEINAIRLAERQHGGVIGDVDGYAFRIPRDSRIAGHAPQLRHQRRGGDFPAQRVLAPAGTEDQNLHGKGFEITGLSGLRKHVT